MNLDLQDEDNPRDYLLALDDIGQPKVLSMAKIEPGVMNTAITCIARLIVMRKGTDMDRPDMGIDIVGRYRFSDSTELYKLQNEIEEQIAMYLPEFLPVDVESSMVVEETLSRDIKKIQIKVNINGVVYILLYNSEESKLEVLQY